MAILPWVILLWLPVFLIERRLVDDPLERRLHLALILVLLATHSSGSVVGADAMLQDPVSLERAVRGVLAALALVVAVPVLVRQRAVLFSRHLTWVTLLGLYVLIAGVSTVYSVAADRYRCEGVRAYDRISSSSLGSPRSTSPVLPLKRSIVLAIALDGVLMAVSVLGFFALPGTFSTSERRQGFITERTLAGVFMSPNALSVVGAVVAVFALARLLKTPKAPHTGGALDGHSLRRRRRRVGFGSSGSDNPRRVCGGGPLILKAVPGRFLGAPSDSCLRRPLCQRVGHSLYSRPRIPNCCDRCRGGPCGGSRPSVHGWSIPGSDSGSQPGVDSLRLRGSGPAMSRACTPAISKC